MGRGLAWRRHRFLVVEPDAIYSPPEIDLHRWREIRCRPPGIDEWLSVQIAVRSCVTPHGDNSSPLISAILRPHGLNVLIVEPSFQQWRPSADGSRSTVVGAHLAVTCGRK
jgi:hypothetical protein